MCYSRIRIQVSFFTFSRFLVTPIHDIFIIFFKLNVIINKNVHTQLSKKKKYNIYFIVNNIIVMEWIWCNVNTLSIFVKDHCV